MKITFISTRVTVAILNPGVELPLVDCESRSHYIHVNGLPK